MINKKYKKWLLSITGIVVILVFSLLLSACNAAIKENTTSETTVSLDNKETMKFEGKTLIISGSTTLLEVSDAWANAFMAKFGGEITVNGGGSGVGIADLINKTNDLANSSRQIKDEEAEQTKTAGVDVKEFMVAYDGIAIITSKNIEIPKLTINQLSDIYIGKITNWKDVNGPDSEIVAAGRDTSSGTGEYFLERVVQLNKTIKDNDYSEMVLRLQSNADVANQVSGNDNCIGYIGLGYLESVSGKANIVAIIAENSTNIVMPSVETVKDKSYPIARDCFVYADGNRFTDIAAAFVDFILSAEGQRIVEENGMVSINK